jgi:glycosyltransferase involved in cell wall biosynthesis
MKLLIVTKTLSEKDGQGRYSLGLIKELVVNHELTVLTSEMGDVLLPPSVKVVSIPNLLSIGKFWLGLKYFFIVKRYLKANDVVHLFTDLPNYLVFSPLLFSRKCPYFITAHGTFSIGSLKSGWRRPILKWIFKRAKKVFCVSSFTKQKIYDLTGLNNLVVINNGVDFDRFDKMYQEIKTEDKRENHKTIVGVGAVKHRKGFEYAVKAMVLLKDKYPDFKYYIVGDQGNKKYVDNLKKIIITNNLSDNITLLENITDCDLVKLYTKADLFLFTPVNYKDIYFEGFGLVCLEAGVCETPVVGSLNCGVVDAVDDGVTGFLVPQKNPQKISQAIDKILSDSQLADKMGKANREFAHGLVWEKVAIKYNNYYESI